MMLLTNFATAAQPLLEMGINIYRQGLLIVFFLIALNLLTFYMSIRLLALYESNAQTQVLQGQLTAYTRRVTIIEAFQRRTEEMRHELKNLLFALNVDMEQENYERAKQRTQELLGDMKQTATERYTGISLIDAVISYKAARLKELGADVDIRADLLDIESAVAYDIASIMGIALDNVTDARELLRTEKFAVSCTIEKQKDLLLMIEVSNPLPAPLRYKNGEIQTTKAESGHGLGLSALRRIVQKYNGEVSISGTDGTFTLSAMLFV
jgi:sensor histidine kinase regulating citrate/malate metabolism